MKIKKDTVDKNIKNLINGLKDLNETLEKENLVPFEKYEVVKY